MPTPVIDTFPEWKCFRGVEMKGLGRMKTGIEEEDNS